MAPSFPQQRFTPFPAPYRLARGLASIKRLGQRRGFLWGGVMVFCLCRLAGAMGPVTDPIVPLEVSDMTPLYAETAGRMEGKAGLSSKLPKYMTFRWVGQGSIGWHVRTIAEGDYDVALCYGSGRFIINRYHYSGSHRHEKDC